MTQNAIKEECSASPAQNGGSGKDAVAGYEYQIDVSVWLALDLVLASKLAQQIVLEPASQEDLEADLAEYEPGSVTGTLAVGGYRLVVQAKLRSGDAWTVKGVLALLKHGSDRRQPAIERLADPQARYLLVTSAALNGKARGLAVQRVGAWPADGKTPSLIRRALPPNGVGRVAVMGNQDSERLDWRIRQLLTDSFRIPTSQWRQCHQALREQARQRISGAADGSWHRADLEAVIRVYQGYVASSPELDAYVYPSQWGRLEAAMAERHAVLIVGQSGTGKTMAAKKLYEKLAEAIPGLAYVAITHGPQQLATDRTTGPVFYEIEDPWGRYDFDPSSRPWNEELSRHLGTASATRLIVATSRLDVARASQSLDSVRRWVVQLEAEHYGPPERVRLYQSRIRALPRELQGIASQAEEKVLSKLTTPLEIQKFFDALPTLDREITKYKDRFITLAIEQAHRNSIERTVREQIGQRRSVRAAAALWGLLKANGKLSRRGLPAIEDALMSRDREQAEAISPLIDFFVAARNLRQAQDTVTYYHPRVEAGIEQALKQERPAVRNALHHLIDALVAGDGATPDWGARTAARILAGLQRLPGNLRPTLSAGAQAGIDTWLLAAFNATDKEPEAHLRLAEAAGSSASTISELARYLFHQTDNTFSGMLFWGPPERDEAWFARLQADKATSPILDAFVRDVLPGIRFHYPMDFHRHLQVLAPDLRDAFLQAANQIVHYGVVDTDDAIAAGALEDIDAFEAIIDTAIVVLTPSPEEQERNEAQYLAIVNGEYNEDYAEYLGNDDSGHTAQEFISAYVRRARATNDWHRLADHRHRDRLLFAWLREMINQASDSPVDAIELAAAFDAALGGDHEDLAWRLAQRHWDTTYLSKLLERIHNGNAGQDARCAALACLVEHAPEALTSALKVIQESQDQRRATGIALELGELLHRQSTYKMVGDVKPRSVDHILPNLPAALAEIAVAVAAIKADQPPLLSQDALGVLVNAADGDLPLRRFRVAVDSHVPLPVEDDIRWLLEHADEDTDAASALDAAARRGITDLVQASLHHRFARVSAHALNQVSASLPSPLPIPLLEMVSAKSHYVREALVAALDAKPHPNHLPTLLQLAQDTWSADSMYYGDNRHFPIARAAASAISKLEALTSDAREELCAIALETADLQLQLDLFRLVALRTDDSFRARLFHLVATAPSSVAQAAALALLGALQHVTPDLAAAVTPALLTQAEPYTAARLALLLACRGEMERVVETCSLVAAHLDRRALVVLVIWVMKDRDPSTASRLAALLPLGHAAIAKALGAATRELIDTDLADLGDPMIVAEVLTFIGKQGQ